MRKESGQWPVASGHKPKLATCNLKLATLILLFVVHCALFTVVTGCGKKAPPKPPVDSMFIGDIKIVMEILDAFF